MEFLWPDGNYCPRDGALLVSGVLSGRCLCRENLIVAPWGVGTFPPPSARGVRRMLYWSAGKFGGP